MKLRNPRRPWYVVSAVIAVAAASIATSAYALTAASQPIKNLATVTYEDAAGNVFSAQSNEAVVTVAQVYSANIGSDSTKSASPGQPVNLSYVLENTGNGSDTYSLIASNNNTAADDTDADSIKIFDDTNGNGQADSGESEITSITLSAGEVKSIVVEVQVPATAIDTETLGITLLVEGEEGTSAAVPGSVTDVSAGKGLDSLDGTVESTITVTADAVVGVSKSSVMDVGASEIIYTITLSNNSNAAAQSVTINDAFPAGTLYVPASAVAAGLLLSNSDILPVTTTLDETIDDVDYNNDGDKLDDGLPGITATDLVLPPSTTVTLTFRVSFDPVALGGGTPIGNTAWVFADVNNDTVIDGAVSTNAVFDTITNTYGVTIADTAENTGGDQINDGQDDDGLNQIQLVDQAAAGGTVVFKNIISNTGNSSDILELSISNSTGAPFPLGTVFTFWDATNLIQLTDSNGILGVDAGVVAGGGSEVITIRATLPSSVSGAGNYDAFVSVTSATKPDEISSITERLSTIVQPTVDVHNAPGGTLNADENPLGIPDYVAVNTTAANVGDSINIPLYIDNDSATARSYQLDAGASYDNVTSAIGALPPGWTVEFFLSDGAGAPTGSAVTSTPTIAANTVDYEIFAVVTVPSDQTQALFDYVSDNDNDGTDETVDVNGDGDGDYPLFFEVRSASTGASDVTLEAIDVNTVHAVTLTPSGSSQVESGGSSTYPHTLANNGNALETLALTAANSGSASGWANTLTIDTTGDGVADTEFGNLVAGTITVQQPSGVDIIITVSIAGGNPTLALPPGAVIPLHATVFAPTTAGDGDTDILTITATDAVSGATASTQDQSQIVAGQVHLTKTVAVDTNCDSAPDTGFAAVQTTQVEPGQCAIWQVVAENQGVADAYEVVITDSVTSFSTFEANSLRYCITSGCTPAIVTDSATDDAGEHVAGNITFYIGAGATPATGVGGTLVSGDQATVRFTVRVD
ncbi:hypothetical protein AB833_07230 [Chromatiales bacterium (ex Bugula neritina AB1)]|nr:hypothetical protein AB833_07230 [Chromatiales bacterium (ex Bugula neritina AB1)]